MAGGGEAAHVGADFRDDDLSGQVTDAGDSPQLADHLAERADIAVRLRVDLGDGRVECTNVAQMQAQREAVPFGDAALQCGAQPLRGALTPRCTRVSGLSGSSSPSISCIS